MSEPFFHLLSHNDPDVPYICADCAAQMAAEAEPHDTMGSTSFCVDNGCADYTEEEHDAILDQADELHDVLYAALNVYAEAHPDMSYDVILHALDCMAYCIKQEMHEDAADA